jgi:putative ABC transport system substrate-binding protein
MIINISMAKRLPVMAPDAMSVVKGALASYGVNYTTVGRLAAKQVHRILQGANPADVPVEGIDQLHFAINLKTAKALGLTIPPSLLQRADQVIE